MVAERLCFHKRLSFCRGGHVWQGGMHSMGVCMVGGVHGRGACMVGGMCGRGGMHGSRWGMHGRGVCVVRGGMRGRRDGYCSRRYASYWNAFLYFSIFSFLLFMICLLPIKRRGKLIYNLKKAYFI